jgi:hypothetical protein
MCTTITVRQFAKVSNRNLQLTLPEDFDYEDVEVIVIPIVKKEENIYIFSWKDTDISNMGKIGLLSASFPEDSEDYSKR